LSQRFPGRATRVLSAIAAVVGSGTAPALSVGPRAAPRPMIQFEHGVHLYLAAFADGWDPAFAHAAWSSLGAGQGSYCQHVHVFTPVAACPIPGLPVGPSAACVQRPEDGTSLTIESQDGQVLAGSLGLCSCAPAGPPPGASPGGLIRPLVVAKFHHLASGPRGPRGPRPALMGIPHTTWSQPWLSTRRRGTRRSAPLTPPLASLSRASSLREVLWPRSQGPSSLASQGG
jgi:hypothetical protein